MLTFRTGNFHFGLPCRVQYRPSRHPLILRAAFYPPGAVFAPARRSCRPAGKIQNREILSFQRIPQTPLRPPPSFARFGSPSPPHPIRLGPATPRSAASSQRTAAAADDPQLADSMPQRRARRGPGTHDGPRGGVVYSAAGCTDGLVGFVTAGFRAFFAAAFASLAAFFALNSAHRFLVASMMCLRPSALSLRFLGADSSLAFLSAAHRFRWAAAMRFLAAKLSLRRGLAGSRAVAARFLGAGRSMALTWAICWFRRWRWNSRPSSAAWRTAGSNRFPWGMRCMWLLECEMCCQARTPIIAPAGEPCWIAALPVPTGQRLRVSISRIQLRETCPMERSQTSAGKRRCPQFSV